MNWNGTFVILMIAAASAWASPREIELTQADNPRVVFVSGRDLFDEGRYADAEKKFREILAKYPKSDIGDRTSYYLIKTLVKLGQVRAALSEMDGFSKNYPKSNWLGDVQEERIRLTDEIPPNLNFSLAAPQAPPPPAPGSPAAPPAPPAPPAGSVRVVVRPGQSGRVTPREDPEVSLQQEILRVMLQNSPDRGIDVAVERLKADPSDPVVISNLHAVANSNSAKALPTLVSIAKTSTSTRARREATFWVARSRGDKDSLVTTLLDILSAARDNEVENAVASALNQIETARSFSALGDLARDKGRSLDARRSAIQSVGRTENPNRVTVLDDIYKASADSADLRRTVASSLSRIADVRAIHSLANIAKNDADTSVRRSAIQYLGRRTEPEAMKALEELLKQMPARPRDRQQDDEDAPADWADALLDWQYAFDAIDWDHLMTTTLPDTKEIAKKSREFARKVKDQERDMKRLEEEFQRKFQKR